MKTLLAVVIVAALAAGATFFFYPQLDKIFHSQAPAESPVVQEPVATTTEETLVDKTKTVLGSSVEERPITAYHFGDPSTDSTGSGQGMKEVLFVGGIHGGYEWNTALVAYQLIKYLQQNPSAVPAGVKVTVIPVVNPDGLYKVTGKEGEFSASDVASSKETQIAGRFNARNVDLNRNFDCDWQPEGTWQKTKVDGGAAAFSEPESKAVRDYIESSKPTAVVVWYSSAGGVYSSNCHGGVLPETTALTSIFAKASGYPAHEVFSYYDITGDMVNWLAKMQIPGISVLLTDHTNTEWDKNLKGVQAVLQHYAQ